MLRVVPEGPAASGAALEALAAPLAGPHPRAAPQSAAVPVITAVTPPAVGSAPPAVG